jgi:hypothetical protein
MNEYIIGNPSHFDNYKLDDQKSFSDDEFEKCYLSPFDMKSILSFDKQPEQNHEPNMSINEAIIINKQTSLNSLTKSSKSLNNKIIVVNKEEKTQIAIGKKIKREKKIFEEERRKYDPDNILLKVEVNFSNFIVAFLNFMVLIFSKNKGDKFVKISPKFKKNLTEENFAKNIDKTLAEIISQDISKKFKNYKSDHNKILCEEIQKDEKMKKILAQNYLKLFQEVYYPSNRKINLKSLFDIDEVIYLPENITMFKDKFKPNPLFTAFYIKKIQNIVNEKYFGGKLKFFS